MNDLVNEKLHEEADGDDLLSQIPKVYERKGRAKMRKESSERTRHIRACLDSCFREQERDRDRDRDRGRESESRIPECKLSLSSTDAARVLLVFVLLGITALGLRVRGRVRLDARRRYALGAVILGAGSTRVGNRVG